MPHLERGMRISFKEFCNSTSLNAFKYFQEDFGATHKILWTSVNITLTICTAFFMMILWETFTKNPTITSLDSRHYPVTQLPYPGVAVCDLNKISRKKAKAISTLIANLSGGDPGEMFERVRLLGHLYDYDTTDVNEDVNKLIEFQNILVKLNRGEFGIRNLMKSLSTSCEELLQECFWKGVKVACSRIFDLRLTSEGYCCLFNYWKQTFEVNKIDKQKFGIVKGEIGYNKGLRIVINNDPEDYLYASISSIGAKVNLFIPTDYPDGPSGGLVETLIGMSSETFLEVVPTTVDTVDEARKYSYEKRECIYDVERRTQFGSYSESDCQVECRVNSMIALCGCVPFMIPIQEEDLVCTLNELQCLQKFNAKWTAIAPHHDSLVPKGYLEKEKQFALRCDQRCYPACDATLYTINVNAVPLQKNSSFGQQSSIVYIFYKGRDSLLYKQDVVYYWYEILSNFGGVFGLMMGFSLIDFVEIVVYSTWKVVLYSRY